MKRQWLVVSLGLGLMGLFGLRAEGQLIAYWPLDESSGTIAQEMVWKDDPTINLDGSCFLSYNTIKNKFYIQIYAALLGGKVSNWN